MSPELRIEKMFRLSSPEKEGYTEEQARTHLMRLHPRKLKRHFNNLTKQVAKAKKQAAQSRH